MDDGPWVLDFPKRNLLPMVHCYLKQTIDNGRWTIENN